MWEEALPCGCFVGVLAPIPSQLMHYQWFSATENIYIFTIVWFAACLLSLLVLVAEGPLAVVSHGACQTFIMIWNLYASVRDERPGMEITMGDVFGAGFFTTITTAVGYYCATRMSIPAPKAVEGDAEVGGPGKV